MKFKFIFKIAVIHDKLLVLFNLSRESDITRSGPDPACEPWIMHPCHRSCWKMLIEGLIGELIDRLVIVIILLQR